MGADPRSTVGTATDANAMLRILFSRLAEPQIGPPTAYSFNVPTRTASGAMTVDKGKGERIVVRKAVYHGGMCPRCEGRGSVTDFDLSSSTTTASRSTRVRSRSPATAWTAGTAASSGAAASSTDKPIRKFTKKELDDLLHKEPTKIKVDGINLTYAGLIPTIQRSMLSKDVDALQPHVRAFVERVVTFTACRSAAAPGSTRRPGRRIQGINIADACAMQITDLAEWIRGLDEPSVAPLLVALEILDSFVEIGLGYLSLDRPSERFPAARRSGQDDPPPRIVAHRRHLHLRRADDRAASARHPADERPVLQLRDKGNTVLVVGTSRRRLRSPTTSSTSARAPAPRAARWSSRAPSNGCGPVTRSPGDTSTTAPP